MPYFDAASSLPLHPVAREALLAALDEGWADPTRLHREGRRARLLLDAAREAAAEAVGCRPDELTFTSSGTRALHTGIAGALAGRRRVGRRLVCSAVEHSAVLRAAEAHAAAGGTVTQVGVDRHGRVAPEDFAAALRPDTALACLQSANHEVGTVQPVAEVAERCAAVGVPLLVDAAQSLGWGPVAGDWSLLAASAHKWGGPGGVGLLVVRKGVRFAAPPPQDEREGGREPGFGFLPAVVAAAASLRAVQQEAAADGGAVPRRLHALVELIRREVPERVADVEVVGDPERRLPHLVTFSCLYVDGEALLHALDRAGFSVSSGSSCTASTLVPSHVLRAMGVLSEGNVRVSLPRQTTEEEVRAFLAALPDAVGSVRRQLGVAALPPDTAAAGARPTEDVAAPPPAGGSGTPGAAGPDGAPTGPTGGAADGTDDAAPAAPAGEAGATDAAGDGADRGVTVDALGKRCPLPVIELAKAIRRVPVGGTVTVLADDEAARLDIPAWCEMRGHAYLGAEGTAFRVRRTG